MKDGDNENLLKSYTYLAEDSLYRADTSDFTKRTITPVMASLAELLRNTPKYEDNYDWFVELARNFHPVSFINYQPLLTKLCLITVSEFQVEPFTISSIFREIDFCLIFSFKKCSRITGLFCKTAT